MKGLSKTLGVILLAGFVASCAQAPLTDQVQQSDSPRGNSPTVPSNAEYRIGPEDVLEISVWKEEGLQKEVLVRPDGGISFPLAGDVDVAGKTVTEVQSEVRQRIRQYIPDAVVTVSTEEISGYRVYVLGKVQNPGQYTVGRYLSVIQALTLAGGLTPFASEGDIKVLRRTPDGEDVFAFDYAEVKSGRGLEQNILLRSGDVVVVP